MRLCRNEPPALHLVAQGEKRLKMVVAVDPENPRLDADRLRAMREAVGDDAELMVDANYLFPSTELVEGLLMNCDTVSSGGRAKT
jgi:hypothetical protein